MPFRRMTSWRRTRAAAVVAVMASGLALVTAAPASAAPPQPVALIEAPATALIGDAVTFTVSLDNTAPDGAGYGPYVDLWLPATGTDGAGDEVDDGLTFTSARYRGSPAEAEVVAVADCAAGDPHPLTGEPVVCPAGSSDGDQLVVLDLGDGGFSATRAPAVVDVTAQLSPQADLGTPLTIAALAGFRHGSTPTGDTAVSQTGPATAEIAPRLFDFTVGEIGADSETVTGGSFPRQIALDFSLAPGQTVTDLDLTYELPDGFIYLGSAPAAVEEPPDTTAPHLPPDNDVRVNFASVTGTGGVDATATIDVVVADLDAGANPVLDPATGAEVTVTAAAGALGDWTPVDARDLGGTDNVVSDLTHDLHLRSLATQTAVAVVTDTAPTGASPGDVLEWTVAFQVSDHFTYGGLGLTTVLTDGQSMDPAAPTLVVTDDDDDVSGAVPGADLVIDEGGPCGEGATTLDLDLSGAVLGLGGTDGVLTGGRATGADTPAATGRLTFRTVVADSFRCLHANRALEADDQLSAASAIEGTLYDNTTQAALVPAVQEADLGAATATLVGPVAGADLVVTAERATADIVPGESVSWLVTARNDGPGAVADLAVVAALPEAVGAPTFTPSEGQYAEGSGMWTGVDLAPGESVTLEIAGPVDPEARGEVVTSIIVDPADAVDPNPDDNVVEQRAVLRPVYDLEITKTALDEFHRGGRGTWKLVVTNSGPSSVNRVTVEDRMPPGLAFEGLEASSEAWACDEDGRTVRCVFAEPMPAGAEETLILETALSRGHEGPVRNTAVVSAPDESGTPEADLTNNESAATAVLGTDVDGDGDGGTGGAGDGTGPDGEPLARTGFGAIPLTVLGLGLIGAGQWLRRRRRLA